MRKKDNLRKSRRQNTLDVSSLKITKFNIFFIDLQLVLTFFTLGLFIWYIVDSDMLNTFQLSLGITLLVMAYNNRIIYRRNKATVMYAAVGVILLVLCVLGYIL